MTTRLAPSQRKKIDKRRAARLFLLHGGICCTCGRKIRESAGERWFIEHVISLVLGGTNEDDNCRPAHVKCKAEKDRADAAARAERDRHITASWQPEGERRRSSFQSRGFTKAPPQHTATRPIVRKADRRSHEGLT